MIYGVLRVDLRLNSTNSLKGKRSIVRKQLEKIRNNFHISVNEVGDNDLLGNSVLGFSTTGSSQIIIESVLQQVLKMIEENPEVEVYDSVILVDQLK